MRMRQRGINNAYLWKLRHVDFLMFLFPACVLVSASIKDPDGYVTEMRHLLSDLPDCNYAVLKYLSAFLVLVTQNEDVNKMNANALATIFGPNMFRCENFIFVIIRNFERL